MTDNKSVAELDPLLHQPVRTRIASFLAARGEATFTEIRNALEVTDGNLEAHMKKLVAAEYVSAHKADGDGRPQTVYALSAGGRRRFSDYVATLREMFDAGGEA